MIEQHSGKGSRIRGRSAGRGRHAVGYPVRTGARIGSAAARLICRTGGSGRLEIAPPALETLGIRR